MQQWDAAKECNHAMQPRDRTTYNHVMQQWGATKGCPPPRYGADPPAMGLSSVLWG